MGDGRIKDDQISASSVYKYDYISYGPQRARLNLTSFGPGYRASPDDAFPWLAINLQKDKVLTLIEMQGYGDVKVAEWVTLFQVMYKSGEGKLTPMKDTNKQPKVRHFFLFLENPEGTHIR